MAKREQAAEVVEEQKKQEENKPPTQEDEEEGRTCRDLSIHNYSFLYKDYRSYLYGVP